ncbi:hypothetical protein IV79_GL001504 [Pediococcus claussenii]|nr:hypothetical protein IV79_GL001504 [Pediococcus claussenii]
MEKDYIEMIPMEVYFGQESLRDRVDIEPDEFYERLKKANKLPSTSSPTGESIHSAFQSLIDRGYNQIIAICISSALSGTAQQVSIISEEFPDIITNVINTKNIGIGSGLTAVYASQLIDNGINFEELITELERSALKTKVFFYVPTLDYLIAGGRIGRVSGMVGSILKIKPIISCDSDGVYYPVAKARSEKSAISKIKRTISELIGESKNYNLAVVHGSNPTLMENVYEEFKESFDGFKNIFKGDISPALGVHTGPGLIGVGVQVLD